jgi:hypothetical protein
MSANVDVVMALELLARLEPDLAAEEAWTRPEPARPDDEEALDRALRAGLARLRVEVGRETFIYLRWRVEMARESARVAREAAAEARRAAQAARDATVAVHPGLGALLFRREPRREIHDAGGNRWAVSEVVANELLGAASPRWLVFVCGRARRHVAAYPPDWRALPEDALLALLASTDAR